jgi:hypothetical protein
MRTFAGYALMVIELAILADLVAAIIVHWK